MAAALVIIGLVGAALASVATGSPPGALPGVALGSGLLLLVERTVAFFAAWMIFVVVVAQALGGRLPTEISGRGVRYADVQAADETRSSAEEAVRRHDLEIKQLRETLMKLNRTGDR